MIANNSRKMRLIDKREFGCWYKYVANWCDAIHVVPRVIQIYVMRYVTPDRRGPSLKVQFTRLLIRSFVLILEHLFFQANRWPNKFTWFQKLLILWSIEVLLFLHLFFLSKIKFHPIVKLVQILVFIFIAKI